VVTGVQTCALPISWQWKRLELTTLHYNRWQHWSRYTLQLFSKSMEPLANTRRPLDFLRCNYSGNCSHMTNMTECDHYRGISLLCIAEKIFTSIILQLICSWIDEILAESQASFSRGHSTIDDWYTFSLRLLAEKYTNVF